MKLENNSVHLNSTYSQINHGSDPFELDIKIAKTDEKVTALLNKPTWTCTFLSACQCTRDVYCR
jgi:hypothetical protein